MNSTAVTFYRCSECGSSYRDKDLADSCCICSMCGQTCHHSWCPPCNVKAEMQRLHDAEIVATGCDEDAPGSWRDDFFFDDMSLLWKFEEEPVDEWPDFIWACEALGFPRLRAEDVVSNALDGFFDDPMDHVLGLDELEAAFTNFYEQNKHLRSWYPYRDKKIDIRSLKEKARKEQAEMQA